MPPMPARTLPWPVLALGDGLAIIAFILVGLSRHNAFTTSVFLRNAVPFLVLWFLAGLMFRAYSHPGLTTLIVTWAIGVPVAVLARSLGLGHPTGVRFFEFLGVTLLMTAVFVVFEAEGISREQRHQPGIFL